MLAPGLAGEYAHVDQSGRQHQALAVDDFRVVGFCVVEEARSDIGDSAVLHQKAALDVQLRSRIDQARIAERDPFRHGALRPSRAMPRESASSTAMRMATPISTCSWMTLTSMSSATAESISTSRFIGPGCMTSAPGLAAF